MSTTITEVSIGQAVPRFNDGPYFRVAPSDATPKKVFLYCHYCGYTPPDDVPADGGCPKCHGNSWERFALSRRLVPAHMG